MQSLKKSLDNINRTVKSSLPKTKSNTLSSRKIETLMETPVNSIMSSKSYIKTPVKSPLESPIQSLNNSNNKGNTLPKFFNSYIFWILLFVFLALMGFNVFAHLGNVIEKINEILKPIMKLLANLFGDTTKTTIKHTTRGTKKIIDTSGDTSKNVITYGSSGITSAISSLQDRLNNNNKLVVNPENSNKLSEQQNTKETSSDPEPVRTSALQHGYCYIGKINDTRQCAKVSARSSCMSGDIYPTLDVCVNPNIRAQKK